MHLRLLKVTLTIFLLFSTLTSKSLIGKKIQHLELSDLISGELITLDKMPSEPYILHFWSSWCHTCHKDHSSMLILAQKYPIVSVVVSDDDESVKSWLEESSNPYLYILDDYNSNVAMDLHIPFAPYTLLVDGNGVVLKEWPGLIKDVDEFLYH